MSYVSRNELYAAYYDCIHKKRQTTNAINFEINETYNIERLYIELNSMSYTIGKSIVFLLTDQEGNPSREVFAADFRDRVVHHLLYNRLIATFEKYGFIYDNYACRSGKGVLFGAHRCQEQLQHALKDSSPSELYILKADFKNCFNTLNKTLIYAEIEKFIIQHMPNDKNMIFNLWLLKLILYHCPQHEGNYICRSKKRSWKLLKPEKSLFNLDSAHGIAVGNLTSQIFANFYIGLMDYYIKNVLHYRFYGRYVDDFYIIHDNKKQLIDDYYNKICVFAKTMDMQINTNKLYIQHYTKGVKFIGYMIFHNRMYICNSTKTKIFKTIKDIENVVKQRYPRDIDNITLTHAKRILPTWNSYMGMLSHVNGYNIKLKIMNDFPFLINKMKKVFAFDTSFYIRLRKHMKLLDKKALLYGCNHIRVILSENMETAISA